VPPKPSGRPAKSFRPTSFQVFVLGSKTEVKFQVASSQAPPIGSKTCPAALYNGRPSGSRCMRGNNGNDFFALLGRAVQRPVLGEKRSTCRSLANESPGRSG